MTEQPPAAGSSEWFRKLFEESDDARAKQQARALQPASAAAQGVPASTASHSQLTMPPGFVGALANFIYQQAPRPVTEVAIVGALGLMAGIVGRAWHIPGSGLNLYVVLVARSAVGKEAMHDGIAKLIGAAGMQCNVAGKFVDFSDYVSGPALQKTCMVSPCFVNVAGEIGHKFEAMKVDRDIAMRSLRKVLTTLYSKSGPDSIAGGLVYSNHENNVASTQGVSFSLIGETTPGTFYEAITDAMMRDGFMSRFCVVEYDGDRPAKNPARRADPWPGLVDHIVLLMTHADKAMLTNQFQAVNFSEPAQTLLDSFEDECDAAIHAARDDEGMRQLWNRAHLKALRVSALLAVGDSPFNPVVTIEQAQWAITLMRHGIAAFSRRIKQGEVGEGSDGGREQKVLELCREFLAGEKLPAWVKSEMRGNGIVPRRYLQQRTQRLSAFEKHPLKHTAALNLAIKTAIANGNLMEVQKDKLIEQYGFFGQAYRVLNLS